MGGRFRVTIEGKNFRGEVYITRSNAREIRDRLSYFLAAPPSQGATPPTEERP